MRRSSFDQATPLAREAPSGRDADGRALPFFQFDAAAAAGLITTPADLARILIALAADGQRLLPHELVAEMSRTHAQTAREDGLWPRYGLGVEIEEFRDGRQTIGHHGMNRGWRAVMAIETASGDGIVAMANHEAMMPVLDRLVHARLSGS